MGAPTIAQAAKEVGDERLIIMMGGVINDCMSKYFNAQNRLEEANAMAFAEMLIDDYKHESVGDVRVFLKRAAQGRYGEVNGKGDVVRKGVIVGRLSLPQLGAWFEQYLGEKAIEAQNEALRYKTPDTPLSQVDDRLVEAMRKGSIGSAGVEVHRTSARLRRLLPMASDEKLRELWRKYPHENHRHLLLEEAKRRGLPINKKP